MAAGSNPASATTINTIAGRLKTGSGKDYPFATLFVIAMIEKVRRFISSNHLLHRGDRVVVGVSGGPDSLALLHILLALRSELGITLHVAHLNHMIRGESANLDVQFVANLSNSLGMPFYAGFVDVPACVALTGMTLEEAGREARYSFLTHLSREIGASSIAIAHNADDQLETVAMHWIRGAGTAGLRGMLPLSRISENPRKCSFTDVKAGVEYAGVSRYDPVDDSFCSPRGNSIAIVRPLLSCFRSEIEEYCRHVGLEYLTDPSNESIDFFRNRLRIELIPLLASYNPNFKELALRSSFLVAEDYEYLLRRISEIWRAIAEVRDGLVVFSKTEWLAQPPSVKGHLIREAVRCIVGTARNIERKHIADVADVAESGSSNTIVDLPEGLQVTIGYDHIYFGRKDDMHELLRSRAAIPRLDQSVVPLGIGAVTRISDDWFVDVSMYDSGTQPKRSIEFPSSRWEAVFDYDKIEDELVLRTRIGGDRFQPLGMSGSKSLQDFMVDAKIDPWLRDCIPLLLAGGQIAWIVGWRMDDRYKVDESTKRVLKVRFYRHNSKTPASMENAPNR